MRTVDFRFLTILVVSVLVLGGACHALHEYQVMRQQKVYVREANRVCLDGKPGSAVDYLKRYLQVVPEDAEARLRVARILRDLGAASQAQSYYTQVLQGDGIAGFDAEEQAAIRYERATVGMQLSLFEIARDDLGTVLTEMKSAEYLSAIEEAAKADAEAEAAAEEEKVVEKEDEVSPKDDLKYGAVRIELNQADVHELLGICLLQLEDYDESRIEFGNAIDLDQSRLGSYLASSRISTDLIQPADPAKAIETLAEMIEKNSDNPDVYVLRGQFYLDPARNDAFKLAVLEKPCAAQITYEESADQQVAADSILIPDLDEGIDSDAEEDSSRDATAAAAAEAVFWWALSDARNALDLLKHVDGDSEAPSDGPDESAETGEPAASTAGAVGTTDSAVDNENNSELGALLLAMRAAYALKLNDEAKTYASRANEDESYETLALPYYIRAEIERVDDPIEAARILEEGITKCEEDGSLLLMLADIQIEQRKIAEAEDIVNDMKDKPELAPYRRLLLGRIHVAKKEWTEAKEVLEDVQGTLPAGSTMELEAKFWLAVSYQALGESDLAERTCDDALALNRLSPAANNLRAALYLAEGNTEKAIWHYRRGDAESIVRANLLTLQQNVAKLMTAGRGSEAVEYLAGRRADINGREELEGSEEFVSVMTSIYQLESRVHEVLGELEEAKRLLEEAAERYPEEEGVWIARVGFALRQKEFGEAEELLDGAESQLGDSVRLRMVRAQSAVAVAAADRIDPADGTEQAIELDPLIEELRSIAEPPENWSDDDRAELRASLGLYAAQTLQSILPTAAERRQALDLAEEQLREAAELAPSDTGVRLLLFDLALARNQVGRVDVPEGEDFRPDPEDWARARQLMEDMLNELGTILEEGDAYLSYGQAVKLTLEAELEDNGAKYDEALLKLDRAAAARPLWERVPALRGRILLAKDERVAAADAFLRAFDLGTRNTDLIGATLALLYEQGRYQDAARLVSTLSDSGGGEATSSVPDLEQRAYELSLRTDDSGLSDWAFNNLAGRIDESQVAGEHLLFGLMLRLRGEIEQAEAQFRTAVDLGPGDPGNWLALIVHLVDSEQGQEARDTLVAADASIPGEKRLLTLARAYEFLSEYSRKAEETELADQDLAKAREYYQDVLVIPDGEAPPNDFANRLREVAGFHLRQQELDEAEQWLTKLKEYSDVSAEDARWARRNLGVILLSRGSYQDLQGALEQVEQNLSDSQRAGVTVVEHWSDQRLLALIFSRWPTREHRDEAIGIYEKLIDESQPPLAADQAALAELHLAEREYYQRMSEQSGGTNHASYQRAAARHLVAALDILPRLCTDTYRQAQAIGKLTDEQARYLTLYAETLLKNDRVTEAAPWARRLEEFLPNQLVSVLLNAEIAYRRGEHDAARQTLEEYLGSVADEVARNVVPVVAARLEGFGNRSKPSEEDADVSEGADESGPYLEAAEALFTAHGAAVPEQSLVLAGFLARQERVDEAVDMMERDWTGNSDASLASAATFVLGNGRDDESSLGRLNELLLQAVESRPESTAIKLVTADVCAWRGDVEQAIRLYQEILLQNRDDVVAANNLAFLLATEQRSPQSAMQLIGDALALQGPVPALLDTRAVVFLSLGQHQQALDDLTQAEQQAPSAGYQMRRAQILLDWGRLAQAKAAYLNAKLMGYSVEKDAHPLEREAMEGVAAACE